MTNRAFRIHPAIGFARVGTSEEYYLAPETMAGHPVPGTLTTGGLPIQKGTESDTIRDGDLRDAEGNLKRQAARFRIYSYQPSTGDETYPMGDGADPEEIKIGSVVDGRKVTDIIWTVHMANKKTGWYMSDDNRGIIAWKHGQTPGLRNADVTAQEKQGLQPPISSDPNDPDRWKRLFTDPGPRAISGASGGPVKFDEATVASYGSGNEINQIGDYPKTFPQFGFDYPLSPQDKPIKTLGELETDEQGRLIVVAAYGLANSFSLESPKYGFIDAVNNDWWFDDTGDGPVTATLVFEDGSTADVQGHGWVISTDPAYAPQIVNVVSLWDDIYDSWVRKLKLRPDLYQGDKPNPNDNFNTNYVPSFEDEIRPIFLAAGLQRWITNLSVLGISAHESIEQITVDVDAATTQLGGLGFIREPVDPDNLAVSAPASGDDRRMPLSLGDAGRGLLSMSYTQYFYLKQWDAGIKTKSSVVLNPGEQLDKAAFVAGLGGRFSPGIDMTYICREPDLYVQDWQTSGTGPFRIHRKPLNYQNVGQAPFLTLGWIPRRECPTPLEPGDISKFMAIPWHADYNSCATHTPAPYSGSEPDPPNDPELFKNPEFNNTLYWSWPAQRPVAVYTAADVTDGKTLGAQRFSVRGPGTKTELTQEQIDKGWKPLPYGPADPAEVGRYQQQKDGPGIARILDHWMEIGTVIQATNIDGDVEYEPGLYLEVQSLLPNEDSDDVQPWPNTVRPGTG